VSAAVEDAKGGLRCSPFGNPFCERRRKGAAAPLQGQPPELSGTRDEEQMGVLTAPYCHASLLLSRAGEASSGAYLDYARLSASQRPLVRAEMNG